MNTIQIYRYEDFDVRTVNKNGGNSKKCTIAIISAIHP